MVVALAGRRIDPEDAAEPRFPQRNVERVRTAVREVLSELGATALVCSAACGADLIALSEAAALTLRRKVILPASREKFRLTSVVDRPGNWAPLYDRILDDAERAGDLWILDGITWTGVNSKILEAAGEIGQASEMDVVAVTVWDGRSQGDGDATADFAARARSRGLRVMTVRTD